VADKVREAGCPDGYGDRHAAKCENAVVAARVIEGAWGDGYIAGRRAALDAPLDAPSGGDATRDEAVRAYLVVDGCGETWDVFPTKGEADLCVSACNATGTHGGGRPGPFRVVALAAPSGSGDALSRDAVAEVLAPLVAKARRPVPTMDGSHNPNPADLAIAREMADAVLSRWRDAAPRGEAGRSALDLVADERRHQIAKWPPAHDDEHGDGQLLAAAVELAAFHTHLVVDDGDPWGLVRKHGKDRVHSLVVAAALIVAEIERLQRSKHPGGAR